MSGRRRQSAPKRSRPDAAIEGRGRLRLLVGLLFLGLAVPAALLIRQGFGQLELESFRREQVLAEGVARRVDDALARAVTVEEARPFADYAFAAAAGQPAAAGNGVDVVQRSPLSAFPPQANVPGTIGYFQVDAAGALTTPLLPAAMTGDSYGIEPGELPERAALARRLLEVLTENRLVRERAPAPTEPLAKAADSEVSRPDALARRAVRAELEASDDAAAPGSSALQEIPVAAERAATPGAGLAAEEVRGQAAFDRLTAANATEPRAAVLDAGRDDARAAFGDEPIGSRNEPTAAGGPRAEPLGEPPAGAARLEERQTTARAAQAASPGPRDAQRPEVAASAIDLDARVAAFQNELDPLQFSRLDTGHFVLYRNAWRDGERFVQGMLLEPRGLLDEIDGAFAAGGLAGGARLRITFGATELGRLPIVSVPPGDLGRQLYAARLSPPLADIDLAFFAADLPRGPGYGLLVWTAVVLFAVLIGGLVAMYRFGCKQIELARQQRNFVSAVSHELKTPLTSIRMYGEMLKSGWASDEKKQSYYDFIFAEGERLSRLIDNVLVLARLGRGGPAIRAEPMTVAAIVDMIRSKVSSQAEHAGVELGVEVDESIARVELSVDPDAMAQVFINLVDNAIKFAAGAERREIRLQARGLDRERVVIAVRDFGPGIPADAMRRLFELFYRPDNELTRGTAGTGIGLALVHGLVTAMGGKVDVRNCEPGAEFRISLPIA